VSRPDATAATALNAQVIRPVFMVYLDIVSDPLRACTAGNSLAISGTGDADLDGFTFDGVDAQFVDISQVRMKDGGSDAVTAKLSGIVGLDSDMLNLLGDSSNWQGRTARLWRIIRDEYGAQQGAIQPYYTGYMVALSIGGSPESQTVEVTIESYLVAFSQASNRSYLDQDAFDPGDLSAKATIAIANGNSGNPLMGNMPVSTGGGYGGGFGGGLDPVNVAW
jgi:hypothetical protein